MTGAEWAAIGVTLFGVVVAIYLSNRDIKNEFRADLGTVQTASRPTSEQYRLASRPISWSDGTSHLLLSPMELLEKRAALVPPPRLHLLRYHGALAPRARDRGRIVLAKPVAEPAAADGDTNASSCAHRLGWAALMARVLGADLSACAACGGRLRIIAALTDRDLSGGVGLPGVPPPRAPPPPFEFAA